MAGINFSSPIIDLYGRPVIDGGLPEDAANRGLTLATVAASALTTSFPNETLSGAAKAERFVLAAKVVGGGTVDLQAEEIALLKKLIGDAFAPLVVGRAWEILDPSTAEA